MWFLGQAEAEWKLHTTLERRSANIRAVITYLKPAIETFTAAAFNTPSGKDIEEICREYDRFSWVLRESAMYLAHLRHCCFPSPLLDWSKSPYVAAYFAFARAKREGKVAIYAYRERPDNFKLSGSDAPQIITVGPNVRTHRRHFRQQSRYTTCVKFENGQWYFELHDSAFGMKNNPDQDLLWKDHHSDNRANERTASSR